MKDIYDDGGANAIRGFNYQKAVIAYIAICNIENNDFYIIPENSDDVEVYKNGKTAQIQVKGAQMGMTKLLAKSKKDQKSSIISKLINKNSGDRFKIATTDKFIQKDFNCLVETKGEFCEHGIYQLSDDQKEIIKKSLKETEQFDDAFLDEKVQQIYIMISMFGNDLEQATVNLLGLMAQKNIDVNNNAGIRSLSELFTQIDQRSEIKYKDVSDPLFERKMIQPVDLKKVFDSVLNEDKIKDIRNSFLEDCSLEESLQKKVERQFRSIKVANRSDLSEIRGRVREEDSKENIDFHSLFSDQVVCQKIIGKLFLDFFNDSENDSSINYGLLLQALAEVAVEKGYG